MATHRETLNSLPTPQSSIPQKRSAENETLEQAYVAGEEQFALQQARKKARIRVRAARAQPIDHLVVTLGAINPDKTDIEEDGAEVAQDPVVDPEAVFEGLDGAGLDELEKGIDTYMTLEKSRSNYEFWQTMKLVCSDRRQASSVSAPTARGVSSVAPELDKLLAPKNLTQLEALEKQIKHKLRTDDDIDVDYWENLLKRLSVHKAKAKLKKVSHDVTAARLNAFRKQQEQDALAMQSQMKRATSSQSAADAVSRRELEKLDPEPLLRIRDVDKSLPVLDEAEFTKQLMQQRQAVLKAGFIAAKTAHAGQVSRQSTNSGMSRTDDSVSHTHTAFDREVARGVEDGEEVFAAEEEVAPLRKATWSGEYKPRKPRYFNRVQMGYEWNKYNQTHYDQDNPPPKVVQGYRFNIFYPDLIDKTKAPTYKIERENGRKRGQSFARAGEDDTCLIRFVAGPPYLDIAFRIVDREWDYSAKRERGFKSSFDKGILQLHFQFKKVYYRK